MHTVPCASDRWQRSGRSTRPPAELDLDNNDASSGNSEHASDADVGSSNHEEVEDDGATLQGEELQPAASLAATATATATTTATAEVTENATGTAVTDARATLLLPLGNLVVVEVGGCGGHGLAERTPRAFTIGGSSGGSGDDGGDFGVPARTLARLDDRIKILHCRGESVDERVPEKLSVVFCSHKLSRQDFDLAISSQLVK